VELSFDVSKLLWDTEVRGRLYLFEEYMPGSGSSSEDSDKYISYLCAVTRC
jgi:hypothetical protein